MIIWVLFLAFALSLDAFSVSVAVAAAGRTPRQTFRLAFHFGLFQFLMPLIGGVAGRQLSSALDAWDHWIAFVILMGIGLHMLHETLHPPVEKFEESRDRSRGFSLVMLSIATSLDALGAGFTIGLRDVPLLPSCLTIGIVAGAMSFSGVRLGRVLGKKISRGADALGGVVLVALAIKGVLP